MRHVAREAIEMLRGLQSPGERDIVAELIGIFLQDAPIRVAAISASLSRGDVISASREAHSLKSSSANLGGHLLGKLCQELETEARKPGADLAALQGIATRIEAEFGLVSDELRSIVGPQSLTS